CRQSNAFQRDDAVNWRSWTPAVHHGNRFTIAQDARSRDPGPTTYPGECRLMYFALQPTARCPNENSEAPLSSCRRAAARTRGWRTTSLLRCTTSVEKI